MKKCWFFLIFLLLGSKFLSANTSPEEIILEHYFNGEIHITLIEFLEIKEDYINDPIWNEYVARCYWLIIKKTDDKKTRADFENKFFEYIDRAIQLSEIRFMESNRPGDAYDFIMSSSTKSGYLADNGKFMASAKILDKIIDEIKFCADNGFDLALMPLGTTQYKITQATKGFFNPKRLPYNLFTPPNLYNTINFDKDEALGFIEKAVRFHAGPEFRRIESLFVFQELLTDHSDNPKDHSYDSRSLEILEELHHKFPRNKTIKERLDLIQFHLRHNKSR